MAVTDLLVEHFPKILDLKFTAQMEDELDDIATAKEDMIKVLDEFYYPFQEELKAAETHMERVQIPTSEICHVCSAPMVLKFGKTGQFLGCSKYPECKATRPLGGQPRAEAVESEHACPKCGKKLLIRENKRGEKFLSCSGFPECKESFNIDAEGNPVPSVVETEHDCEKCGKPMVLRQGSRGRVPGLHRLSQVPQRCCRSTTRGKPVQPVKVEVACAKCGGADGRPARPARRVPRLPNYPKCRGTAPIPDELKDKLAEQASPAAPPAADLKAIPSKKPASSAAARCSSAAAAAAFSWAVPSIPSARERSSPARPRSPRSTRSSEA